jgi:hypothetical protein
MWLLNQIEKEKEGDGINANHQSGSVGKNCVTWLIQNSELQGRLLAIALANNVLPKI